MTGMNRLLWMWWLLVSGVNLQIGFGYKCIRYPGGGIYFWWMAGASHYLQEKYDLTGMPVVGVSAGAIAASLLASKSSFSDAASLALRIAHENKVWDSKFGMAGILKSMIDEFLEEALPDDISSETLNSIHIAATPQNVYVNGPTKFISNFADKRDLKDAVLASSHIPLFMDGKFYSVYKDEKYVDGEFWSFVSNGAYTTPAPAILNNFSEQDVLHIDFKKDELFMKSLGNDKSIVKLITPDGLFEMMDYGYTYMNKLHKTGQIKI
eukprot:gene3970-5690_t